ILEVHKATVVWRPGRRGSALAKKRAWRAARQRNEPFWRARVASLSEPDVRAVAGKALRPQDTGSAEGWDVLREVGISARADLTEKQIEFAIAIGDEADESPVRRNRGACFGARPVCET